jgi:hypothetical protein
MLAFLKRLLWDESAFERYVRLICISFGGWLMSNAAAWQLPAWMFDTASRETWMLIASTMLGLGGLISAGQKNVTLRELVAKEREGEK